jgi:hypothetical protein
MLRGSLQSARAKSSLLDIFRRPNKTECCIILPDAAQSTASRTRPAKSSTSRCNEKLRAALSCRELQRAPQHVCRFRLMVPTQSAGRHNQSDWTCQQHRTLLDFVWLGLQTDVDMRQSAESPPNNHCDLTCQQDRTLLDYVWPGLQTHVDINAMLPCRQSAAGFGVVWGFVLTSIKAILSKTRQNSAGYRFAQLADPFDPQTHFSIKAMLPC